MSQGGRGRGAKGVGKGKVGKGAVQQGRLESSVSCVFQMLNLVCRPCILQPVVLRACYNAYNGALHDRALYNWHKIKPKSKLNLNQT